MKEIVIFDVDNTIIRGFTQGLFIDFLYKKGEVSFFYRLILGLWLFIYKLGFLNNPKPAMQYGLSFIKGKTINEVDVLLQEFFETVIVGKIYKDALVIIKNHQENKRHIILVSNAPNIIIKKLADYLNISEYISTNLEINNGIYTGEILGEIIYAKQKLSSVNKFLKENNLSLVNSWGYGDHETDVPLLSEVTHPFAVNPSKRLERIATKNNWPILIFR